MVVVKLDFIRCMMSMEITIRGSIIDQKQKMLLEKLEMKEAMIDGTLLSVQNKI